MNNMVRYKWLLHYGCLHFLATNRECLQYLEVYEADAPKTLGFLSGSHLAPRIFSASYKTCWLKENSLHHKWGGLSSTEPRFSLMCAAVHTKGIPSGYSWHLSVVETILLCSSYLGKKPVVLQLAHFLDFFFHFPSKHTPQLSFLHSVQPSPQLFLGPLVGHCTAAGLLSMPGNYCDQQKCHLPFQLPPSYRQKYFTSTFISSTLGPSHWFPLFTSMCLYTKERGTVLVCFPSW